MKREEISVSAERVMSYWNVAQRDTIHSPAIIRSLILRSLGCKIFQRLRGFYYVILASSVYSLLWPETKGLNTLSFASRSHACE